jgi:DNA-binding CsgD family transcriptional regulator
VTATYLPQIAALPPRDQRMVDLLAAGATQIRCAGVLGVNRSTVVRRLQP